MFESSKTCTVQAFQFKLGKVGVSGNDFLLLAVALTCVNLKII